MHSCGEVSDEFCQSRLLLWSCGRVARRWEGIRTARLLLVHGECGQVEMECDVGGSGGGRMLGSRVLGSLAEVCVFG